MCFWVINSGLVFLLCVFLAGIVIPQILLIAFRRKLFDVPDERKIHHVVVPRLGGIAFKPVILFSIYLLVGINMLVGHPEISVEIENNIRPLVFELCAIMVLYLVGMADDLIGVKYRAKFTVQIMCGAMLIAGGICIDNLHGILGLHEIPGWFSWPLTVLVIVFIVNAVNLIDGIDGLASGLCSCACLFYGMIFFMLGQYIYAMLSFATLGVLVPFFYYNVFGNPNRGKKIFMGDTGSLTIGIILSFLSIRLTQMPSVAATYDPNPIILAFSPLMIPCLDVVRVYIHRVQNKQNPFLPDKNHIHHKLLAVGIRQRLTMVIIVCMSLMFMTFNILLSKYVDATVLLILDIAIWICVNILISAAIKRRKALGKISEAIENNN